MTQRLSTWQEKSKSQELERQKEAEKRKLESAKQVPQYAVDYSDEGFQAQLDRFVQEMPASIRDFLAPFHTAESQFGSTAPLEYISDKFRMLPPADRLTPVIAALSKGTPDKDQRIHQLLHWCGAVPESGPAPYLGLPTELLLRYEPDDITKVIKTGTLSHFEWVGASHYFASLKFRRRFPNGYAPLDQALKKRIRDELAKDSSNQRDLSNWNEVVDDWAPWTRLNRASFK